MGGDSPRTTLRPMARNAKCPICNGHLKYKAAAQLKNIQLWKRGVHVVEHLLDAYDLEAPRYPGWAIRLFMHLATKPSAVLNYTFILAGTDDYPNRDPNPTRVLLAQTPLGDRCLTQILGTCSDAHNLQGLERNVLRVGRFLVWEHEPSMTQAVCLYPIAHMVAWYKPETGKGG